MQVTKYDKFWGEGSTPLCPLPVPHHDREHNGSSSFDGLQAIDQGVGSKSSSGNNQQIAQMAKEPVSRLRLGNTPLGSLEYILDPDAAAR